MISSKGLVQWGAKSEVPTALLQCCVTRLKPAGPSDMVVDRGNVYVVPRDDEGS
jgi:hypothetical protein